MCRPSPKPPTKRNLTVLGVTSSPRTCCLGLVHGDAVTTGTPVGWNMGNTAEPGRFDRCLHLNILAARSDVAPKNSSAYLQKPYRSATPQYKQYNRKMNPADIFIWQ